MKQIIRNLINGGGYDLQDMIGKINYYHVSGQLTDADREELIALAREKAVADQGVDARTEILALWEKYHALEKRVEKLEGDTPSTDWPEWVRPTGAHDAYNPGDRVTYKGKHYICTISNNVWSPDEYPAGWEEEQ